MSFATYWAKKLKANPWLKRSIPFKILPRAFQTELRKAYDEGHSDGARMVKQLADLSKEGGAIDQLRKEAGL